MHIEAGFILEVVEEQGSGDDFGLRGGLVARGGVARGGLVAGGRVARRGFGGVFDEIKRGERHLELVF